AACPARCASHPCSSHVCIVPRFWPSIRFLGILPLLRARPSLSRLSLKGREKPDIHFSLSPSARSSCQVSMMKWNRVVLLPCREKGWDEGKILQYEQACPSPILRRGRYASTSSRVSVRCPTMATSGSPSAFFAICGQCACTKFTISQRRCVRVCFARHS